jgi:hypothetical protein
MIRRENGRLAARAGVAGLFLVAGLLFAACGGDEGNADGSGTTSGNDATTIAGGDGGGDAKKGEPPSSRAVRLHGKTPRAFRAR